MKNSLVNLPDACLRRSQAIDVLYSGCMAQNPRIQRLLFERLSPKMLSLCLRYIKETAAAEDVLLVSFRKVFDRIAQFGQKGSFEGWIRRIVVNECLMHLEKQRAKFREIQLDQANGCTGVAAPDNALEWEDLQRMVAKLPEGYRRVFELFALNGYSHEEISKKLSISESTSKSQLSRARVHLQRLLYLRMSRKLIC